MTDETMPSESPVDETLPVEPVDAAPEPEREPEPQEPDDTGTQEEKPKGGFQRRIKELADERNYWREMAMRPTQQEPRAPEAPKPAEPVKLPKLEDFGYDEAQYQAALIQYATKQAEEVVNRRLSEADKARAEQARIESFVTRQKEFAKATPDFEDRVLRDPTLPITEAMRDVIVDSPSGPELAYYLATNRELADQIARLPPHLAALEMGRIDGRLQAQKEAKRAPVVTKAPPPPPKVEETAVEVDKDPEEMSADQWLKWREKQLRKRNK